ncbi:hypothetical protein B484DRAFT_434810, partial [Ochromonadaceae sp. CCMP2298]
MERIPPPPPTSPQTPQGQSTPPLLVLASAAASSQAGAGPEEQDLGDFQDTAHDVAASILNGMGYGEMEPADDWEDSEEEEEDEEEEEEGAGRGVGGKDNYGQGEEGEEAFADEEGAEEGASGGQEVGRKRKRTPNKRTRQASRFFLDEADEGAEEEPGEEQEEQELGRDEQAAIDAVERRHSVNRARLARSAEEEAADFDRRAQEERRFRRAPLQGPLGGGMQLASLPSSSDAQVFRVKCSRGKEMPLVRACMLKAIDIATNTTPCIKSAFTTDVKGCIFVEAASEALARGVVHGLRGLFRSSLVQ